MIRYGLKYGNRAGGSTFDDLNDLKLPTLTICVGVEAFWKNYLVTIRFIYDKNDKSYPKIYHGNEDNTPCDDDGFSSNKFMLLDDEYFESVIIHVGQGEDTGGYITVCDEYISFVTGIEFRTTKGRRTCLYGLKDRYEYKESFDGYVLGYVTGRSGLVIDELGFVWYNQSEINLNFNTNQSVSIISNQLNDIKIESESRQTSSRRRWCCW